MALSDSCAPPDAEQDISATAKGMPIILAIYLVYIETPAIFLTCDEHRLKNDSCQSTVIDRRRPLAVMGAMRSFHATAPAHYRSLGVTRDRRALALRRRTFTQNPRSALICLERANGATRLMALLQGAAN